MKYFLNMVEFDPSLMEVSILKYIILSVFICVRFVVLILIFTTMCTQCMVNTFKEIKLVK
jgi:hypothetical protein